MKNEIAEKGRPAGSVYGALMGPGQLIAIAVLLLYTILAPLVLYGVYVLFDHLGRNESDASPAPDKDPSLWTDADLRNYFRR